MLHLSTQPQGRSRLRCKVGRLSLKLSRAQTVTVRRVSSPHPAPPDFSAVKKKTLSPRGVWNGKINMLCAAASPSRLGFPGEDGGPLTWTVSPSWWLDLCKSLCPLIPGQSLWAPPAGASFFFSCPTTRLSFGQVSRTDERRGGVDVHLAHQAGPDGVGARRDHLSERERASDRVHLSQKQPFPRSNLSPGPDPTPPR